MKLHLYRTKDSVNVINKTLTDEIILDINLKSSTDIINPEIVLNGDFRGFNYAYIPELNRYYIIKSLEQLNLKLVKLNMTCDVLETYKDYILNIKCNYTREYQDGDLIINTPESNIKDNSIYYSDKKLVKSDVIILNTIEV